MTNTSENTSDKNPNTVEFKTVQKEVIAAMQESLRGSKLEVLLKKYNLQDDIKIILSVDKNNIQSKENINIDEESMVSLQSESIDDNFSVLACAFCYGIFTCCDTVWNPCNGC
ncbi:MAG: hypothetical protein ACFB02_08630 [Mastigocoleus sp.]